MTDVSSDIVKQDELWLKADDLFLILDSRTHHQILSSMLRHTAKFGLPLRVPTQDPEDPRSLDHRSLSSGSKRPHAICMDLVGGPVAAYFGIVP